ncbi:hypothetical protein ACKWTF_007025 [Chironomus riparius]
MIPDDIHYHTAIKCLENRYELERNDIPDNWIRHHNFKKFLDSRLSSQDNFYEIDCRFLLPSYNFEENKTIDLHEENNEDFIFNEDYGSMNHEINHHGLQSLITHPVIETIINLKIQKYDRLLFWNFLGFVLFYIIPTIFLAQRLHSNILPPNTNISCYSSNLTFENIISKEFLNNQWHPENDTDTYTHTSSYSYLFLRPKRFAQYCQINLHLLA